jgi:drug/metabolite transporter (DMT)-like permease
MRERSWVLCLVFILLAFLWGGSFVAIKETVGALPSWFSAAMRLWIATAAIYIVFAWIFRHKLSLPSGSYLKIWGSGLITLGIPFAFLFWGEKFVSAGIAGMINGSVPLFTALMLHLSASLSPHSHRLSWNTLLGLGLGFVGVIWIFAPMTNTTHSMEFWGAAACLVMAICYALGNILNQRNFARIEGLNLYASVFHQHLASLVFLSLGSLWMDGIPSFAPLLNSPRVMIALLYLGVFSTALALSLYFFLIKRWGSVRTSAIAYLIPVFTILLDALVYGNLPTKSAWLGISLILIGIFFLRHHHSSPRISEEQKRAA